MCPRIHWTLPRVRSVYKSLVHTHSVPADPCYPLRAKPVEINVIVEIMIGNERYRCFEMWSVNLLKPALTSSISEVYITFIWRFCSHLSVWSIYIATHLTIASLRNRSVRFRSMPFSLEICFHVDNAFCGLLSAVSNCNEYCTTPHYTQVSTSTSQISQNIWCWNISLALHYAQVIHSSLAAFNN